jgi:hypothetical protein
VPDVGRGHRDQRGEQLGEHRVGADDGVQHVEQRHVEEEAGGADDAERAELLGQQAPRGAQAVDGVARVHDSRV